MKSTLLIAAMIMASTMAHAQLKVDSVGHVGIGSTSTTSLLSVGGSESGYIAAFKPSTGNGVFVKDAPIGINIQCNKASGLGNGRQSIGLNVVPESVNSLQASYGVLAGGSPTNRLSVGVGGLPERVRIGLAAVRRTRPHLLFRARGNRRNAVRRLPRGLEAPTARSSAVSRSRKVLAFGHRRILALPINLLPAPRIRRIRGLPRRRARRSEASRLSGSSQRRRTSPQDRW